MSDASIDFDDLEDVGILDLAAKVRDSWQERDDAIARATTLRKQDWKVKVPDAWKHVEKTQHSSLSKEIPARVVGTITLREPVYSRTAPDDDMSVGDDANTVERFLQAKWQYDKRTAVPGKNSYMLLADMLTNKGAACAGSIYAPDVWADAPLMFDGGELRQTYWRDSTGRVTETDKEVDYEASSRAYSRDVDRYIDDAGTSAD